MKYIGSCHCQQVKFECELNLEQPTMCNCSYCLKRNAVHHATGEIKILTGEEAFKCYQFSTMKVKHNFCQHCGIFIFLVAPALPAPYYVNLCTLENCDWQSLPMQYFDGASL